jgi:tRNA A-37 threonylcarbamoyl transferase component Bud32
MNIVINPDFQSLADFIKRLPQSFDKEGQSIYKSRNELKIFDVNGVILNVKSYRKPIFVNRVIYTFFRKSKARRAFENAQRVLSLGFDTPNPVAYIEDRDAGLLNRSYFVSLQCPYTRMFREFADKSDVAGREDIIRALGLYAAKIHEAGIFHLDLSVGNILFEKDETGIHFSLVDLNRMKFCTIDQELGCENFGRLRGNSDFFKILAESYAKARGFDAEICLEKMLYYLKKNMAYFNRKHRMKKYYRRKG